MSAHPQPRTLAAPAKVNLFLAVTGRRPDGYHELVSLVAPLDLADRLTATPLSPDEPDRLTCDDPALPTGGANLVLKAAAAYRAVAEVPCGVHFALEKHIPEGAGLGGGSSDAAAALRLLDALAPEPLPPGELHRIAATVGSDVPLFLTAGPSVLRGRGEEVAPLPPEVVARLRGTRLLLLRPEFAVSTAQAYGALARKRTYLPADVAEGRLAAWFEERIDLTDLCANSFEAWAFGKYLTYPALRDRLRTEYRLDLHLTGSGSAAFVLLPPGGQLFPEALLLKDTWGADVFHRECLLV